MNQQLLPFNYDQAAYFYDTLELDTELNERIVDGLLKVLGETETKKIWDAACGTGAQSIPLAEMGYDIVGSDICQSMISIAGSKAELPFYEGDMCTFNPGSCDAVIVMMNSLGHISKYEMKSALKNFASSLDAGGLLIGDADNRKYLEEFLTDEPFISRVKFIETEKYIRKTQAHKMKDGIYEVSDIWMKGSFITYEGTCEVQSWYKDELEALLFASGFKSIKWFTRTFSSLDGLTESESDSLLFVAKKA